jgi:DNA-binding LacI/PurR family transcriptional regulator
MANEAPTVRSLARLLGLSRTTVSDALRETGRTSPETAERVRKAAEAMGYRRNPLAASLMSELRRSRGTTFRGVLAAVDLEEPGRPPHSGAYHAELVQGASERAVSLGFKLEKFAVGEHGVSQPRLDSILKSRGIHGVILLPAWQTPDFSTLDWSHYAGVYTDNIIERPALHSICSDQYRSLISALHRLREAGYQRPGVFVQRHQDERLQHRWTAAFRSFHESVGTANMIPPLVMDTLSPSEFTAWFRKYNPDVVLGHHSEAIDWMESCGARVPITHGFATLNASMRDRPCAGLDLQAKEIGARAVELVIAQLQRNERGLPPWPTSTTILGRWVDGPTIRVQTPVRAEAV